MEYARSARSSNRGVLKNDPENKRLAWITVPKTVWRFLDGNKARFAFFNSLLFLCFFYDLVPPYVVGKIVDFFSMYQRGAPLDTFYNYVGFLTITYAIVALVRLTGKNQMSHVAIVVRSRVKVVGFERLTDASLAWHAEENTGNKVQRICHCRGLSSECHLSPHSVGFTLIPNRTCCGF